MSLLNIASQADIEKTSQMIQRVYSLLCERLEDTRAGKERRVE